MAGKQEVEIKFRVQDLASLRRRLRTAGFREITRPTLESNTLFDNVLGGLADRGEVLRIRRYGKRWTLTHKSRGQSAKHKVRTEMEMEIPDGETLATILGALGYQPSFRYEKVRSEWTDGKGHVVLDETPIGDFGEIEGTPAWIDRTAKKLGLVVADYITSSYMALFFAWKRRTNHPAREMTWKAITGKTKR